MSTTLAKPVSRPWRRFLRFSVRGMIVVVLVIGVWLGWIVRDARIQRDAVAAIRKEDGGVKYDWEWNYGIAVPRQKHWPPRWLGNLIGVDYFGHVTAVVLVEPETDAPIAAIGRLTQLQDLGLFESLTRYRSGVGDASLEHLKGLTNLSVLNFTFWPVTDAELAHLTAMTKLSTLGLPGTEVTDAGLVNLKCLRSLAKLDLSGTKVTDDGLTHLKALTNLSKLELRRTRVTRAGVEKLTRALPKLTITR
jgi:hypothetical protein